MRIKHWVAPLALVAAGMALAQPSWGYDDVRKPVKPAGTLALRTAPAPRPSPATMAQGMQDELAAQFQRASGARSSLTAQQAKKAGWGFVADHFGQIDSSGKGYVTLAEISSFMAARSPQKLMQGAPQ
ncbi:hypothetical protein [Inquilinus limosus]|uniref:EF-hand domain-containing protein n=1 Tax=Inquilinus limosus TaxID=171674 RepID=A0A211ZE62_9PROT|nr:hypothetical protein [Inquilinus limosus]OWJ63582.1 hypothetical protein BWR60_28995 [Inquilinus limosus]